MYETLGAQCNPTIHVRLEAYMSHILIASIRKLRTKHQVDSIGVLDITF